MAATNLNAREERFVSAYLKHGNGTRAATEAGYSVKTARAQASRLLTRVNIQAALNAARDRVVEETHINGAWLLNRLADLAEVKLTEIFTESGDLREVEDMSDAAQRLIAGIEVTVERDRDGDEIGTTKKIKLESRLKVLELIGRHIDVSAFTKDSQLAVDADALVKRIMEGRKRAGIEDDEEETVH